MSHFIFKAKKPSGETYSGEKDAADRYELYRMVRESGDEIVAVTEKKTKLSLHMNISLFSRVKTIEKINFARNLGAMLEAGLALSRALSVLERQTRNKKMQNILRGVIEEVAKGTTFSDALAKYPKVFPQIFISMAHAGEQSGTLAESLKLTATQMDNSYALERRVRGALIYPAIILTVMTIIAVLMFIFVVPTLMKTFTDLNVQLPLTTRIVLGVSTVIEHYGLLVLIGIFALAGLIFWWRRTSTGKRFDHFLILKLPVLGSLVQEVNAARTARTLSSLLSAGVDVVESIQITSEVVQNVRFRAVLSRAKDAIKKGDLMSKVFSAGDNLYPIFLSEMMSVGEETGKIGEMLLGVAKYYEDDIEIKTKDMSTIVEPVLMVIIAAAVGFFAVSMISPIYSLVSAM
ncbi:type II secretion system F family protein [Patescibacteria group bacterium]|nr:type II secretion system F family protein [Patescibacteria group bacterium]MDE1946688.1 type II secretion system F family protein [Patescibacteria group bacterium]MDE2010641.1 type II secretion system F family protein [Patescibacteria group bacterium]MDE2233313.1 type II secretion system F family protein [Patescibacteria group bacterium]